MSKNTNIADLINYISVDGSGNVVLTTGGQVATQSYVTTAVSNLVNAAPSTLDTLNELATALGNDANFATTVTTSIATKQAQLNGTGFVKVSGTTVSYDNSTYLTSITSGNVTTALGFTPYNSTNPSGYITSSALSSYLPLTGGTLTGALSGTSLGLSSYLTAVAPSDIFYGMQIYGANGGARKIFVAGQTGFANGFTVDYNGSAFVYAFNSGTTTFGGALSGTSATFSGNILFSDSGTSKRGIQGTCGTNDFWFVGGGASASNAGYLEIATGDDGQTSGSYESIYVSQYGPGDPLSGTLVRRAKLLDEYGNTYFPNTIGANKLYAQNNIRPGDNGYGAIDFFNNGFGYQYSAKIFTFRSPDLSEAYGLTNDYGSGTSAQLSLVSKGSTANIGFYTGTSTTARVTIDSSGNVNAVSNITAPRINTQSGGGVNIAGGAALVLGGSGASFDNTTGARLVESYGPVWNCSNSSTWHHQVINGSSLVGLNASGGNYGSGNIYATGSITASYSDVRLKKNFVKISDALSKVCYLSGYTYQHNELGQELLKENPNKVYAGFKAQEVQAVLPEAVTIAPFDLYGYDELGNPISKSGESYLTINYDRLGVLFAEAIKELKAENDELRAILNRNNII